MSARMFAAAGVAAAALLAASPAHAFRGLTVQGRTQPPEFGSRDLARIPDSIRQAALTASPAWRAFVAANPGPWRVTWDDRAGTPREIVGGTIALVPESAPASKVESAARAFLNTLAPLSGVSDSLLRTHTLRKVGDTWFVRFDRVTTNGVPVANAFAEVRITRGRVVLIRLETHPMAESGLAARSLVAGAAIGKAHDALSKWIPSTTLTALGARAVVEPIPVNGAWAYRPAFEVETKGNDGGHWLSVVDAVHGEVLSRESLTRWAVAGTLNGMTEPRLPGDSLVAEHMSFATPSVGGSAVVADTNGAWSSTAAAPANVVATLSGSFVHVANAGGANSSVAFSAANATGDDLTFDATNASTVEIDAFRHITEVRAWALSVAPSLAWLQQQLTVNVNLADTCNSYWDGTTVNLFSEDATCNNTARIADVVYHEFGHGFHQNNLVSGVIDGAMGEGSGDYISVTLTNDHLVGPKFFKSGGEVRDVEPNAVYPTDLTGEVHNDGLIWVGAMWDLRKALIAKDGYDAGRHATDLIFAKALATGPTLDQAYDEVLLADDDDGNLANGTPNQCEIDAAFGLHGLNSTSSALAMAHVEVVGPIPAAQAIPVTVTPPTLNAACGATLTGIDLKYTVDGAAAQTIALTPSGSDYGGSIPAFGDEGHVVRYWFEAHVSGGTSILTPPAAPENSYGFYVGSLFEVFKDDFDHGDKGWTHGGANDDWQIGAPTGQGSDPTHAYSGTNVLGNNLGGDYAPNTDNYVESPTIDCRGCSGARLELRRWLSVEDATYDHANILVNGQQVYANPVGAGAGGALPKDPLWSFEDYDISAIADGHNVKIRFQLTSDQGAEYGGWNLDDVSIVTPTKPLPVHAKGCGCDLGGDVPGAAGILPALFAAAALLRRRKGQAFRSSETQESIRR